MILYGAPLSPYVRKVLVFAAEKGITLDLVPVGLGSEDPGFLAASPFRKMPALRDGEFTLADSSAIVHYIEALHVTPELIPTAPHERGRIVWWDEFADTIFVTAGAKLFFNRVVAPRFLKRDGDLALADRAEREELPPILDYLEGQIPERLHLVGERLTLADIAVASPFVNLAHAGFVPDGARWPRIAAFIDAILGRASFDRLIAREKRALAA